MTTLALYGANADSIAQEIVRRVETHLHRLAVGIGAEVHTGKMPSTLHEEARAIVHYAQRGLPVWDWTDSGMAADGLLAVVSALYSHAADYDLSNTALDVVDDLDPVDEVTLVLVAAGARIRLDQGVAVTARELAALSGMTASRLRQLIAGGELSSDGAKPARVPAEDAVRWLASRSVPGFRS